MLFGAHLVAYAVELLVHLLDFALPSATVVGPLGHVPDDLDVSHFFQVFVSEVDFSVQAQDQIYLLEHIVGLEV